MHRLPAAGHLDAARLREEAGQRLSLQGVEPHWSRVRAWSLAKTTCPRRSVATRPSSMELEQVVLL